MKKPKVDLLALVEEKTVEWLRRDDIDDKQLRQFVQLARLAVQICKVRYGVNISDDDVDEIADRISKRRPHTQLTVTSGRLLHSRRVVLTLGLRRRGR